ncbi:hypothetical protein BCF11_0644 [Collimonas sp. PA-H2]|uniref:hypothetical protein n=1 Tax=Collimonas sp. PA-H2 TaxID=1881062 RepID=UPI000BF34DE9|nr:hypothetical protein [Collimonas sp. PA-H2]PFH08291.1 hypothetical protein BCF11_0644 [Collimonas sp. PA-H2]
MQPPEETARGSVKPNLLSGSTATDNSSGSILNALEGKNSPAKGIAQKKSGVVRGAVVLALLAAIGAGGFFAWNQRSAQLADATAASAPTPAAPKELPSSTPVLAANTPAPEKTESQAAVIENDPATHTEKSDAAADAAPADPRAKLTESLEAGVPVTATSLKSALEEPKPAKAKPAAKSVNAPLVNRNVPDKKAVAQKPAKAASTPPDSDVNILSALVSHGDSVNEPAKPAKETAKSRQQAKKKAAEPVLAQNASDGGPDIVERKSGDSTAGLLLRCRQLGMIEGELCRWRICSGRWDTDTACKVNR